MEVVALRKQERTAEFYAEGIKQAQRKSTRAVLEGCAIADQAYRNLTDSEFKKLPGLTDLSAGTLSKLRTIHKQRHRFEERLDDCPSGWTTLYPLAKLTDAQFNQLVTDGKLRPDLTEKTLELLSGHFHSDSASDDGDRGSSVVATIRTTGRMPEEQLTKLQAKIKGVLDPALKGTSARVILPPERKSAFKDKNRTQLAADLEKLLAKQLAPYNAARASLSENEYEVLENAAWQHEQRKKSGKYPYAATDPNSIERSEHPYSIKNKRFADCARFRRYLRDRKIITPYFPIPEISELGEALCIQLAIRCCDRNARARHSAKLRLNDIGNGGSENAAYAKKYLHMLEARGV